MINFIREEKRELEVAIAIVTALLSILFALNIFLSGSRNQLGFNCTLAENNTWRCNYEEPVDKPPLLLHSLTIAFLFITLILSISAYINYPCGCLSFIAWGSFFLAISLCLISAFPTLQVVIPSPYKGIKTSVFNDKYSDMVLLFRLTMAIVCTIFILSILNYIGILKFFQGTKVKLFENTNIKELQREMNIFCSKKGKKILSFEINPVISNGVVYQGTILYRNSLFYEIFSRSRNSRIPEPSL